MRIARLKRIAAGLFSAAVLGAVPVAAWLAIGPGLLPETYAVAAPAGEPAAIESADLPVTAPAGDVTVAERSGADSADNSAVLLLNAWYYTAAECETSRGGPRPGQTEASPKGCPPQRGSGK